MTQSSRAKFAATPKGKLAGLLLVFLATFLPTDQAFGQASAAAYTTGYRWDPARHLAGEISAPANASNPAAGPYIAVRYSYDANGRLIKIERGTLAVWKPESILPADWGGDFVVQQQTEYTYDARGFKVLEQVRSMPDGIIRAQSQFSSDANGLPQCSAIRMNIAQFGTPPADPCLTGTPGTQGADRITRTEYDAAGQLVQVRMAVGTGLEQAYVTYTYTPNGKREQVIDAGGNRAKLEYDRFDRQSRWIFPAIAPPSAFASTNQATALANAGAINPLDYEEYGYDPAGNRTSLRKRDGTTLTFQYDLLNRMTVKQVPERTPTLSSTHTRDVYFSYDLRGLQRQAVYDSAAGIEGVFTNYDAAGRVIKSALTMDGVNRVIRSCYDPNGNRTRATYPDSTATGGTCAAAWTNSIEYTYDGLNRPLLVSENGSVPLRGYSYNGQGQLITDSSASGPGGITSFDYDPIGRLQAQTRNLGGTQWDNTTSFAYNTAAQIVQEARTNDSYAFTARFAVARPYSVNGLNQYTSAGSAAFCYDANGNLTADGSSVYLYDVENRLVEKRVQGAGNSNCAALAYTGAIQIALRYDPMGRLYETVGPVTGTTRYVTDGDALVAEYNGAGTLLRRYVHGANGKVDDPIAWYEGSGMSSANVRFLHANHLGSIVAVTDAVGTAQRLFRFDEYGIPEASDGAILTPESGAKFLYTGQVWLPELGMYYYKARMYSPTLGRFLQIDPIGYDDQVNLYAYVRNDSLNRTDPTGTQDSFEAATRRDEIALLNGEIDETEFRDRQRARGLGGALAGGVVAVAIAAPEAIVVVGSRPGFFTRVWRGIFGAPRVLPQVGTNFGRLGTVIPRQSGSITGYTVHGAEAAATRGVSSRLAERTVARPEVVLQQSSGNTLYATKDAVVVLNRDGKVVTTYGKKYFDEVIRGVLGY